MTPFNELPVKIQNRMLDCQVEQGNEPNTRVFMKKIHAMNHDGGFNWCNTLEGKNAWSFAIIYDNYDLLYEANPNLIP